MRLCGPSSKPVFVKIGTDRWYELSFAATDEDPALRKITAGWLSRVVDMLTKVGVLLVAATNEGTRANT